jgi:hypothetical protein
MLTYPDRISDEQQLEDLLSSPGGKVAELFSRINGDIMFLGIGGKIGPTLARWPNGHATAQG